MHAAPDADAIKRVRVVVLGDSGCGKTSFTYLLCNDLILARPVWTVGCNVEVKLHEYLAGTKDETPYFVEFWDIGGSKQHANSRSLFYQPLHGLVLVYDLTNRKSRENLKNWVVEIFAYQASLSGSNASPSSASDSFNTGTFPRKLTGAGLGNNPPTLFGDYFGDREHAFGVAEANIPVLVVGTKADVAGVSPDPDGHLPTHAPMSGIARELNADEIRIDCHQAKSLAAGSTNSLKVSRFLDQVIAQHNKRTGATPTNFTSLLERRKLTFA